MFRILTVLLIAFVCTPAFAGEGWEHSLGIYGWFSGLEGTIGVGEAGEVPVEVTFSDLANYVDFALAGHYEATGTSRIWVADLSFVNLGAERDAEILNQPVKVEPNLEQWIVEFGHGWRLSTEFTVFLALRYYDIDTGLTLSGENNGNSGSVSKGWADGYLGGRWAKRLGSRWTVSLRGDVGAGGSQIAWFGQALVGFDISERFSLAAAWRILSLDHESDKESEDYLKYDITQSGLGLGLAYKF